MEVGEVVEDHREAGAAVEEDHPVEEDHLEEQLALDQDKREEEPN